MQKLLCNKYLIIKNSVVNALCCVMSAVYAMSSLPTGVVFGLRRACRLMSNTCTVGRGEEEGEGGREGEGGGRRER